MPYGLVYPILVVVDWVGQNRETNKEHDEDCVKEGFHLARLKLDKDGETGREALGIGNHSIKI